MRTKGCDLSCDLGPGAGINGGLIIQSELLQRLRKIQINLGDIYCQIKIDIPKERRISTQISACEWLQRDNLKNIDVDIPIGVLSHNWVLVWKINIVYDIFIEVDEKLHDHLRLWKHKSIILMNLSIK
jgi:hypothetical protein